jgi:flagellar hook-basal body complex protein FliE
LNGIGGNSVGGIGSGGGIGAGSASGINEIIALRQQIIDKSQLLQQIRTPQAATATGSGTTDGAAPGFAGALQSALAGVNASQTRADQLSEAYDKGQITDVAKVMLARQEAGVGFEATLQVRNKLLSAYQDIMKLGV